MVPIPRPVGRGPFFYRAKRDFAPLRGGAPPRIVTEVFASFFKKKRLLSVLFCKP
jgi:hypothetical protein